MPDDPPPPGLVVISYAKPDQPWATWIAWCLEQDGHRIELVSWPPDPGSNVTADAHRRASAMDRMVLVLSPAYLSPPTARDPLAEYRTLEWTTAFEPDGRERRLVPVVVAPCERVGLLAQIVAIDLVEVAEPEARRRLCDGLRDAGTGARRHQLRPADRPAYPGGATNNLPPADPWFHGRDGDLAALGRATQARPGVGVHVIRGLGGVGKTQLALRFAADQAADYDLRWWLPAKPPTARHEQLAGLADSLGIDAGLPVRAVADAVRRELGRRSRWLLIVDGADDPERVLPYLPAAGPAPPGARQVLVTAREGRWGDLGTVTELDVLPRAGSLDLLRARLPARFGRIADSELDEIAERLGDLPLALRLLAADLETSGGSPRECLEALLAEPGEADGPIPRSRSDRILAATWAPALRRLRRAPAAEQLLRLCCALGPGPVPLGLVLDARADAEKPLAPAARAMEGLTRLAGELAGRGLAGRGLAARLGDETITIHPVVALVVRRASTPDQRTRSVQAAVSTLEVAARGWAAQIADRPAVWPRWEALLPHVLAVLDRPEIGAADAGAVAELTGRAATYRLVRGEPGPAVALFWRALQSEPELGSASATVARRLRELADAQLQAGQPDAALASLRRAVDLDRRVLGARHAVVATDQYLLGQAHLALSEPGPARQAYEKSLRITTNLYGAGSSETARGLGGLGRALLALGAPREAAELLERAVVASRRRQVAGPQPETVTYLAELAAARLSLGDADGAHATRAEALDLAAAVYPPGHPARAALAGDPRLAVGQLTPDPGPAGDG